MVAMGGGFTEEELDCTEIGLTRRGSRDRVDDRDFGGDFVASQSRAQVLDQRVGIGGCGPTQFHHRDHLRLAWIYLRRYGPELGEAQRLCLDSQVCGVSRQS